MQQQRLTLPSNCCKAARAALLPSATLKSVTLARLFKADFLCLAPPRIEKILLPNPSDIVFLFELVGGKGGKGGAGRTQGGVGRTPGKCGMIALLVVCVQRVIKSRCLVLSVWQ